MSDLEQAYYEADSFWAGEALRDPGNTARMRMTAELVPNDVKSLLDAGCGNGVFGEVLQERRPEISFLGVDRSTAALRHAKVKCQAGSIDKLPFDDAAFDCVSCLQVLEHLPVHTYERALAELLRVSRRYVIVGLPYREDLARDVTTCPQCCSRFNVNLHLRSYDDLSVQQLFAKSGTRLIATGFPSERSRPKYLNEFSAYLRRKPEPTFLSPICPVCGYTEGDRTALSLGIAETPAAAPQGSSLKRKAMQAVLRIWPHETVRGYWVIGVYQKPSPP